MPKGVGVQLLGANVGGGFQASGEQSGVRPAAGGNGGTGRNLSGSRAGGTNWTTTDALYSITDLLEILKVFYPAPMFFRDRCFRLTELCWGDQIACDFQRGDSVALPFCHELKRGIAKPRPRWQTNWITPGYIKSINNIKALDLLKRLPNESPFSNQAPENRLNQLQMDDLEEADLGISRREEVCCSKVLFDGRYDVIDGDDGRLLQTIDFGPINRTVIPPAAFWDLPGSDPLADLRNIKQSVIRAGYTGSLIVFGQDVATSFLRNESVRAAMNFLNYQVGHVNAEDTELFGIASIGSFFGLQILEYSAMYRDPFTNMMDYYMPPDQILIASPEMQHRLAFGECVQVDPEDIRMVSSYRMARVPQYVKLGEEDSVAFRLMSRPCPIPVDVLSWTVATVVTRVSMPTAPIAPFTEPVGTIAYAEADKMALKR